MRHRTPILIAAATTLLATTGSSNAGISLSFGSTTFYGSNDAYTFRYGSSYAFGYPYYGRYYRVPYWYSQPNYPASLYVDTETLIALAERVDPQLVGETESDEDSETGDAQPAEPKSDNERAAEALADADYEQAAMLYERVAEANAQSADSAATAKLNAAIAFVGTGEFERASKLASEAFKASESLTRTPIGAARVGGISSLMRLAGAALRDAQNNDDPDRWFLAGVLLTAAGETAKSSDAFAMHASLNARR